MDISQFLTILKARFKIFLICFGVTVFTAVIVTLLMPKAYKATASLVLNYKGTDPVSGAVVPGQLMPGYVSTQLDIIQSEKVALKVVDKLSLADNEGVKSRFYKSDHGDSDIHDWLAAGLLGNLTVKPSKDSSVLEITFKGANPNFAALVANAFAEAYQETSIELRVEPAQKAANYFSGQTKIFRDRLQQAQEKLSKFQQDNGITNPESQLDVETNRLNELTGQLVAAQSQSIDTGSRKQNAITNKDNSPDILASPLIQQLKVEVAKSETKLAELSQRVGKNHPDYVSAQAEYTKLKTQLTEETQKSFLTVSGAASINQQRESELRSEVNNQKSKVLNLNRLRDQLALLKEDVDTAQRDLGTVSQRFSQTNIDAESNQSDIAILNLAKPPISPSSPRVILNILLASFVGIILGLGFSLLAELLDKRVRSREDIVTVLDTKVLAVISPRTKSKTKKLTLSTSNSFSRLLKDNHAK